MSDDKREKLREYLRNNKPKSKINLGNNSNNKENSNKNLEDDLNSDNLNLNSNSNLNNSQISNNKINSNKRDYDKEPIVIENNVILVNFIALIIGIFFIIAIFLFFKLHETTNSSFGSFSGLVAILVAFLNRQSSKIIYIHGAKSGSKKGIFKDANDVTIVCVSYTNVSNLSSDEFCKNLEIMSLRPSIKVRFYKR
ncbi:hypothetical protein [Campylobacter ureolyticus]|uniref:Uncharacterized protein n=2 Tax=Campylobacter ureolyticus TaxID=827 RepID=A0A9Q4KRX2_9BACT|nr:hypothetical protein [Campylobacter ureolyticus]MCZ6104333.1 hypothetical protein [Campylobacter ureolyticus]MCZ6135501.1 hypothetical protein [Campylobacter ureolyticus]MCZ6162455.1 hypothetical protein [Campylobacter ureolyticus]MCZ6171503.1 hypothetical protein [Campylobacter ureolyticus]MCZ6174550.1 hypothetical protein [Campylobacter ureolyticus]